MTVGWVRPVANVGPGRLKWNVCPTGGLTLQTGAACIPCPPASRSPPTLARTPPCRGFCFPERTKSCRSSCGYSECLSSWLLRCISSTSSNKGERASASANALSTPTKDLFPMSLHEETDAELKAKLSSGELGDKKTAVAEAVLRRRRAERIQEWLQRHVWLEALVAALGLTALVGLRPSPASNDT